MKPDLSTLPRYIISHGKKWFKNTKTGKLIPANKIMDYLPKTAPDHEAILSKRYDLNY